ncbi:glycosyltransferase family 4 protein [Sphingosinithalassobacter tenebrarum]|uniref:Glycosyltransferase family 4 protein n=2 Tax=Stakelama tenebrarum TaxID=2711215 RepID=A0A6G6YAF6_9SPHN|nr:glycosyltransferase family 4 protein [Sphingosinithalassobacter tenebrarum]
MATIHILHLHSTFAPGGKELRAVQLMNAFGDKARHTIASAMPDQLGARERIASGVKYEIAQNPPPLTGKPSIRRYEAIANYMRRFDLVLTYNWGAIDGVMAARVFGRGLPPVVHHEDGFNADEAARLNPVRNMYRRIALPAANALVVPSKRLEKIAQTAWKQPAERIVRIPNGIETARFAGQPNPEALPGFERKPGETVIGTVAGLREVKDLPMLVRAVGGLSQRVRLVIVGEGPERQAILDAAEAMGLENKLLLPGFVPDPWRYMGLFDIFALSSKSEQFPISVVEAMAAGLPICAPPAGDVPLMVAPENANYIGPDWSEVDLRNRLEVLVKHPHERERVGAANRAKARSEYDDKRMIRAYAELYESAMGRKGLLSA